jgi:class 3 adenylate cyclase/DNA-binding winged helix-turn-helix (wHTH) protein/predicted ATPase
MHREGSADVFVFEGFRLDRRGSVLYQVDREGVGTPVSLGSRAFNLLHLLIERKGELVSKDDIMNAVWPGRVVEEANLNVQIGKLRQILDADRAQGSCIRTISGRGYCFVAPVKQSDAGGYALSLEMAEGGSHPRQRLSMISDRDLISERSTESDPSASSMLATTSTSQPPGVARAAIVSPFTEPTSDPERKYSGRLPATPTEISGWLRELGLEQYESAFHGNNIDADVLRRLTSEDLRELGVESIGHRRRLLDAIAALRDREQTTEAPLIPSPAAHAAAQGVERRQLTALFCGLVGSTAVSTHVDPEDLREVISAYHNCVDDTVGRFGGFIAGHMGEVVSVYFGYPEAHEDDAERAVRAGAAVIDAVGRLARPERLSVQLGIASGLVVVGDLTGAGAQEHGVVGETPNLAARLQALAQPDTLVIAESTRRQIGALFQIEDSGLQLVAGFAEPQRAWRVTGESGVLSRFEALRSEATPLVGREEELDLLLRRWRQAKTGEGRVVLISGEPGIGKSRLTAALSQAIQNDQHTRWRYFCSPHHQDSALYPFIVQLERAAGFARDDTVEEKVGKLRGLLGPGARGDDEIELLTELLSLPSSAADLNLSPRRKREKLFEALLHRLEALARNRPVLLVFEDAHWIDPTSRELLELTIDRVSRLSLLVVVTFRPEFLHAWSGEPQMTILALNRLDRRDRTVLVEQIAGGKALPNEVVAQIADRADGVPLFVEELTKSVLESGLFREEGDRYVFCRPLTPLAIPTSLHASLLARLDRLASARLVAQIGAAIGREFSYALLCAVSRLPDDELQAALGRLVASELVIQRGTPPDAVYSFKHALVQDAAHGTLLRAVRSHLHAQIAEVLATQSPELMDTQPELFAQHYAEAGLVEKSVVCWGNAGRRSAARSAMVEAVAQFQKGLDQLALLPDNRARQRQELEFYSALGDALFAAKGPSAPETGQAYARARGLWEQLGSPAEYLQVPYGQFRYHQHLGELDQAQHLVEDLLRLSLQRNDSAGLVLGHHASGTDLWLVGRFASSRPHYEEVLALYDPILHSSLVHQAGVHLQVASQAVLGNVVFCLGYPEQALAQSNAAIAEARRLAHPASLCSSLAVGARLHSFAGDDAALDERAGQLAAVATEQGFSLWRAEGTIYRGWAKVKKGDLTEGISLLRRGSVAYRATGAEAWTPYWFALLAKACEIAGQIDEAVTLLDDALQIVERTQVRCLVAELNRHKGQLLLRQGHGEAAEELYRKALSIAEEQEAKLWELRAATSLARLWRDQGRRAEARDLLAPVYGWFTEGFDTPDLKEAKALLEALNLSPTTFLTAATLPKRRLVRAVQNPLAQSAGQSD